MTFPRRSSTCGADRLVTADEGAGSVGITLRFLAREPGEKGDAAFRNKKARRDQLCPDCVEHLGTGLGGPWSSWIASS